MSCRDFSIAQASTRGCARVHTSHVGVGRPRSRYGTTRISTKSFYTHHGQMLVKAAVVYDALAINKQIIGQRQKLCHDAGVAHAAGPGEESA